MNANEVLIFIQKIAENSSTKKYNLILSQLEEILKKQNADISLVELVRKAQSISTDIQTIIRNRDLSEEEIEIAHRRAMERRQREMQMARQGRC